LGTLALAQVDRTDLTPTTNNSLRSQKAGSIERNLQHRKKLRQVNQDCKKRINKRLSLIRTELHCITTHLCDINKQERKNIVHYGIQTFLKFFFITLHNSFILILFHHRYRSIVVGTFRNRCITSYMAAVQCPTTLV
jgi:hypothetical protein